MSTRLKYGISFPPGGGGNFLACMLLIEHGVRLWGRNDEHNNEWYVNPSFCYRGYASEISQKLYMWASHDPHAHIWHEENDVFTEKVYIIKNTKICSTIHHLKRYWNPHLVTSTGQLLVEQAWKNPYDPSLQDSRIATLKSWNQTQNSWLRRDVRHIPGDKNPDGFVLMSYIFYSWLLVNPWHTTWQNAWDNFVPWLLDLLYADSGSFGDMTPSADVKPQQMFSLEDSERLYHLLEKSGRIDKIEIIDFDELFILKTANIPGVDHGTIDRWTKYNDFLMLDLIKSIHNESIKQEQLELTKSRYINWQGLSKDK